jgi:mannose-6-phosphate isomerase-like protein (cupin superfamily)
MVGVKMRSFVTRPWGWYQVLSETPVNAVKILCVKPGERLSLQTHRKRSETWIPLDDGLEAQIGENLVELKAYNSYEVPVGVQHRLINPQGYEIEVVELITGAYDENDISRIEDDYGRS